MVEQVPPDQVPRKHVTPLETKNIHKAPGGLLRT